MNRVGLFAGAFDPIHDGHIEVARTAVELLELDKLYFMVEPKPWGNKQPVDAGYRKSMVSLAIQNDAKISQLDMKQDTFTLSETLADIEKELEGSELYFVFGGDVFMNMNNKQWPGLQKLLKHYIVVFERKAITEKEITEHARELGIVVAILPSAHPNHSSTNVRMKPHSKAIWVPQDVAQYIQNNNLY